MRLVLLTLLTIAAPLGAQCYHVPDDTPSQGRCNWVPFGRTAAEPGTANQRYQTLLLKSDLGGADRTLCSLAFSPCGTGWGKYTMSAITIRMAHFSGGSLGMDLDANLGANPVTVFQATNFTWTVTADQWNEIRFLGPFDYVEKNGDIVVEIVVAGSGVASGGTLALGMHRHSGRQRVFDYGYTGTPPQMARFDDSYALKMRACEGAAATSTHGQGCPASRPLTLSYSGIPTLGATIDVHVDNGPQSGAGFMLVGLDNGPPLPLDLGTAGLPGCMLYISQQTILGISFAGGRAKLTVPIPNDPSAECTVFYNQATGTDPTANPAGVSVSNYGRVEIGGQ